MNVRISKNNSTEQVYSPSENIINEKTLDFRICSEDEQCYSFFVVNLKILNIAKKKHFQAIPVGSYPTMSLYRQIPDPFHADR